MDKLYENINETIYFIGQKSINSENDKMNSELE